MAGYKIIYDNKDITKDLSDILVSLEYSDKLEGRAGDLEITLADLEAQFLGSWYPETDDKIEAWIGDLYCGAFWVDEVENSGDRGGTRCTIRSMSIKSGYLMQTKQMKSHRGRPLADLANEVASAMNLTVKGSISGTIQDNCAMNDLEFLSTQATKLGYILKIDSGAMIFAKYADLKSQTAVSISKKDVVSWTVKDKAIGRYQKCTCKFYDAQKKKSYTGTATLGTVGGVAEIWEEVDSNADAIERAKDWLENKNKQEAEIDLEMVGSLELVAGMHVNLVDFGKKTGSYIIKESTHSVDRSNKYKTKIKLQK